MALAWREEGAQIIGGCCGTRPDHIAAARERLAGTKPGHRRRGGLDDLDAGGNGVARSRRRRRGPTAASAACSRCRSPTSPSTPACSPPGEASFCLALPLPRGHRRAPALPRRRLRHGHPRRPARAQRRRARPGIDVDRRAVANTLTNAFRNGVADRLTAQVVDLFPWLPEERYEVDRREPLPAARRPVPRGVDPPRGRLLGPPPASTSSSASSRARSRPRASPTSCSSRSSRSSARPSCWTRPGSAPRSSTGRCSACRRCPRSTRADRARRGAQRRLPPAPSASATSSSPTCSRSRPRPARPARQPGRRGRPSSDRAPRRHARAAEVEERLERLRVLEAVRRRRAPGRAGPVSEIVDRAPAEACRALGLDRCVLSRIDDGRSSPRRSTAPRPPATPRRRSPRCRRRRCGSAIRCSRREMLRRRRPS